MTRSSRILYRKLLAHAPALDVPVNVYERLRLRLYDWADSPHLPFELRLLAGQYTSLLLAWYGRNLAIKDIRRLLHEAAEFRDRFRTLADTARGGTSAVVFTSTERSAISVVYPYMVTCHEDFDAHVRALRHLWFGPMDGVRIEDDWHFDVPANDRRRFLAKQFALAALCYVDAAQMAVVLHRKWEDATNYSLRCATALRRAIELNTLTAAQLRSEMARDAAAKRHLASPKAVAKTAVRDRWLNWKANRERHRSTAQFAIAMVNDFDVLESPQTIERWVREWEKQKKRT